MHDIHSIFAKALPETKIISTKEEMIAYSYDATATLKEMPACVIFPKTPEEVATILKIAGEQSIPVVTRGSGTGLSGGSIPCKDCVILVTLEMNRILELDTANLCILAEPGVITKKIEETIMLHGLFYPPDPGSMIISSIGGNVANNSGGLRGLKYGVTRDYVMGMEVVMTDGRILWLGSKCVKDVAGYSLKDLFIGSEGTLGVITKVLLKLIPRPEAKRTLMATYSNMETAAQAVSDIIAAKIVPCTMEFLDARTIRCVEDYAKVGLPLDCEALLLLETDGVAEVVHSEAEKMAAICRKNGAMEVRVSADEAESAKLATARRVAFSAVARISPTTILEDVTVPRSLLAKAVKFVADVAKRYEVQIATFGHMGDGNLHPTFLTDERNHEEMERVEKAMREIFDFTIELGGTITGEHGVGLAKKPFLPAQFGEGSMELLRQIKRTLDPQNILNPGKIFDL